MTSWMYVFSYIDLIERMGVAHISIICISFSKHVVLIENSVKFHCSDILAISKVSVVTVI